ncbi:glycosyltransferase family 39 protein [Amycolatopsis rhizosphaerae]|nr:glycosyltransferase family 39 protein [Amycolatopsis rhizosphaerae]
MTIRVPVQERIRFERVALGALLLAAAALYVWSPAGRTFQPYYAAAIRSMAHSARAFLFAGYDPAGVVTLDKPPLAFWVQATAAWAFGYHWWLIAAIQAAEGVAAVFVLHRLVRRWAGPATALLAAALLVLCPITTAISRDDTPDSLLVLILLLAAYCATRAAKDGHTGWLTGAGALIGLGFLTKMLMAWAVLPALAAAYLAAPVPWRRKVARLALAGVVMLAVSLSWPLLISLWPGDKPFVGSTGDGSIWQLILGYNGFGRLVGADTGSLSALGGTLGTGFGGSPGPLRLFDTELGGQIAWLLPLALVSVAVAAWQGVRRRAGTARERAGWLLWGCWLIVYGLVFSFTGGIFHGYYTSLLAPAVAAAAAAGLVTCAAWYRAGTKAGVLLPAAIAGTTALSFLILSRTPDWLPWLRYTVVVLGPAAALGALTRRRYPALIAGLVAILAGPAAYVLDTAAAEPDIIAAADPSAGPARDAAAGLGATLKGDAAAAYAAFMDSAATLTAGQDEMLRYASAKAPDLPITLAVEGGSYGTDPYLIHRGATVVPLGGYLGLDPAPTAGQLAAWVHGGRVRFVLLPAVFLHFKGSGGGSVVPGSSPVVERIAWFTRQCRPVPAASIGQDATRAGVLFDCG